MDALGNGGFWSNFPPKGGGSGRRRHRSRQSNPNLSSESINLQQEGCGWPLSNFPLKQSVIASGLALSDDIIAQLRDHFRKLRQFEGYEDAAKVCSFARFMLSMANLNLQAYHELWSDHDWLRSLHMASYGFLLYGPGSYAWYQLLDHSMPKQIFINLSTKVLLNQVVLGPCVIAVIFAWNNLWVGKLSDLSAKYRKDALPTLYGFRFWIPVSILNFGSCIMVVVLAARVAFMSTTSIFWNFYLSSTLSKQPYSSFDSK